MSLESHLKTPLNHNFYYRPDNTTPKRLTQAIKTTKNIQYVVDTCIFVNSSNVIGIINNTLLPKNYKTKYIEYILKSAHIQLKHFNNLAEQNQILITPKIYTEYKNSSFYFRKEYRNLQIKLETHQSTTDLIYDTCDKLKNEYNKLKKSLKKSQFKNTNIIDLMVEEFKQTPFYVEKIEYSKGTKIISDADLGLFMLAIGQNTFSDEFKSTKLLTNDYDFLAQGVPYINGELLKSPTIIKPIINMSLCKGNLFELYGEHNQPKTNQRKVENFLKNNIKK
jgi:hypothetical protein